MSFNNFRLFIIAESYMIHALHLFSVGILRIFVHPKVKYPVAKLQGIKCAK